MQSRLFLFLFVCVALVVALQPSKRTAQKATSRAHGRQFLKKSSRRPTTRIYEDFNLNEITVVSAPEIFSEKQLRESAEEWGFEDERSLFGFQLPDLSNIFSGGNNGPKRVAAQAAASTKTSAKLKKTVSVELLESRTAGFVKGSIDAKAFANTLKAAFGDNLSVVKGDILSSLPASKAKALSKLL